MYFEVLGFEWLALCRMGCLGATVECFPKKYAIKTKKKRGMQIYLNDPGPSNNLPARLPAGSPARGEALCGGGGTMMELSG